MSDKKIKGMFVDTAGKVYVDTQFINRIQYAVPGSMLHHMGWGEFYLDTPKGRVDFDRMRGHEFEGCEGRGHLLTGKDEAIALVMEHAEKMS